jgi:EAL domain-containing protein (putative c-di-GMP-specific phosphodiesterase class I)
LAKELSCTVLGSLRRDFAIQARQDPGLRISFGALRAHALHPDLLADLRSAILEHGLPGDRLEIRIAESAVVSRDPAEFAALRDLGVYIVADEVGRDLVPLARLARAPLHALQLDRSWVTALPADAVARRMCAAIIGVAQALGLDALASGVDTPEHRLQLLQLGCQQGSGDLYGARRT